MPRLFNEPVRSWQLTDAQLAAVDLDHMPWPEEIKVIAREKDIGLNTVTFNTVYRRLQAEARAHKAAYTLTEWRQIMADMMELQAKSDALDEKLAGARSRRAK